MGSITRRLPSTHTLRLHPLTTHQHQLFEKSKYTVFAERAAREEGPRPSDRVWNRSDSRKANDRDKDSAYRNFKSISNPRHDQPGPSKPQANDESSDDAGMFSDDDENGARGDVNMVDVSEPAITIEDEADQFLANLADQLPDRDEEAIKEAGQGEDPSEMPGQLVPEHQISMPADLSEMTLSERHPSGRMKDVFEVLPGLGVGICVVPGPRQGEMQDMIVCFIIVTHV